MKKGDIALGKYTNLCYLITKNPHQYDGIWFVSVRSENGNWYPRMEVSLLKPFIKGTTNGIELMHVMKALR